MPNPAFLAHGTVSASFDPSVNILFLNLSGPFNLEFMETYKATVAPIRNRIQSNCWGSMVNVHGLALAPMSAIAPAAALIEASMAKGLVATAVLFHQTESRNAQERFWRKIYEKTSLRYGFFNEAPEAQQWLVQQVSHSITALRPKSTLDSALH